MRQFELHWIRIMSAEPVRSDHEKQARGYLLAKGSRFGHGPWKVVGLVLASEAKEPIRMRTWEDKKD
jgi:hypothetical protein